MLTVDCADDCELALADDELTQGKKKKEAKSEKKGHYKEINENVACLGKRKQYCEVQPDGDTIMIKNSSDEGLDWAKWMRCLFMWYFQVMQMDVIAILHSPFTGPTTTFMFMAVTVFIL